MGISFFTFKAISYLVDIYKGRAVLDANPVHDALYLSFFGQIQSGPLTRYQDMKKEDGLFSDGVYRFVIGFNKKVLIANVLANITNEVFSNSFDNFSTSYAWLGAICYSLQLFFDFAGYSDMAIGISEMFGYKCMENFNFPYMTESVSRFWRRWHISLSQWFRDYIYIPMGGSRQRSQCRVYFNLLVVWALTGIWHGASWNFVVWGLGYFVLIAFEHATGFPEKFKPRFLKLIYRIFSLFFINFEWVLFRADDLATGLRFIKKMFICAANPLADVRTMFLIKDYLFFIVIAIILCFPVVSWMDNKLKNKKTAHAVYGAVIQILAIAAFIWAISFVVSGQNNPFAYANF
jgi:alginate O-acetyltransferase complex protein AlgI